MLQVRRYSDSLQLLGTITVRGGFAETHLPYRAGNGAMVVHEGELWLMLPQQEFKASDGLHHQAAYLMRLDFTRGKAERVYRMASHSFAQYLASDGTRIVTAEHGDAYSRAIEVTEHVWTKDEEYEWEGWDPQETRPLPFPGRMGDNFTGATLNGLALGSTTSITTGLSQPQKMRVKGVKGQSWRLKPNVWVAATNEQTGATSFRWITTFHPKRTKVILGQPRLTRIAPDRFVLLYGSDKKKRGLRTHYVLLDGQGRSLVKKTFKGEFTPLAEPVLQGKRLVWVNQFRSEKEGYYAHGARLAALNLTDPTKPKRVNRG